MRVRVHGSPEPMGTWFQVPLQALPTYQSPLRPPVFSWGGGWHQTRDGNTWPYWERHRKGEWRRNCWLVDVQSSVHFPGIAPPENQAIFKALYTQSTQSLNLKSNKYNALKSKLYFNSVKLNSNSWSDSFPWSPKFKIHVTPVHKKTNKKNPAGPSEGMMASYLHCSAVYALYRSHTRWLERINGTRKPPAERDSSCDRTKRMNSSTLTCFSQ